MSWYTKYRPKTFDEVVEQHYAKQLLNGESSTYILHGASGVGKTTMARIMANNIDAEVIEIDAATNNGVDNVRALIASAYYSPPFNNYRMFIVDECHMLTTQAWNALLKVLEECPPTTMWVFCTTELSKVPTTIQSRCVLVPLKLISYDGIVQHLENIARLEGYEYEHEHEGEHEGEREAFDENLEQIAYASEGRLREAIVLLETYLTIGSVQLPLNNLAIINVIQAVFDQDYGFLADNTNELTNQDTYQIIRFIADYTTLLLVRTQYANSYTTESILEEYTHIPVSLVERLRDMQDSIWKQVEFEDAGNPIKATVNLLHGLYEEMMKHYNDFTRNQVSLKEALLWYSSQL